MTLSFCFALFNFILIITETLGDHFTPESFAIDKAVQRWRVFVVLLAEEG